MDDVRLPEVLRSKEYDGVVAFPYLQNALETRVKTGDIGHEVNTPRLTGVASISQAARGHILFVEKQK